MRGVFWFYQVSVTLQSQRSERTRSRLRPRPFAMHSIAFPPSPYARESVRGCYRIDSPASCTACRSLRIALRLREDSAARNSSNEA